MILMTTTNKYDLNMNKYFNICKSNTNNILRIDI